MVSPHTTRTRRQFRLSLLLSGGLHLAMICIVPIVELAAAVFGLTNVPTPTAPRVVLESRVLTDDEYRRDVQRLMAEFRASAIAAAEEASARPLELAESNQPQPSANEEPVSDKPAQVVLGERVATRVMAAATEAEKLTDDQGLDRLKELSGQLDKLSSNQSVDEMANKLRGWLGTEKRADRPSERPVVGTFDPNTAQLHDVKREAGPDGQFIYTSILVDAQGRTMEVSLEAGEGESTYRTFKLLKSNPLAEMVYRKITMSLLDNLIKAKPTAPANSSEVPPPMLPANPEKP